VFRSHHEKSLERSRFTIQIIFENEISLLNSNNITYLLIVSTRCNGCFHSKTISVLHINYYFDRTAGILRVDIVKTNVLTHRRWSETDKAGTLRYDNIKAKSKSSCGICDGDRRMNIKFFECDFWIAISFECFLGIVYALPPRLPCKQIGFLSKVSSNIRVNNKFTFFFFFCL